jgi:hypothetical protein
MSGDYQITLMFGELHLEPIKYWIGAEVVKRWWFWSRVQYWVCCEFSRVGPFDSEKEALEACATLRGMSR